MEPIEVHEGTVWLSGDKESVSDLPVVRVGEAFYSAWAPSWRDRLRILCGARVWLGVLGPAHPPVTVQVGKTLEGAR